MIHIVNPELFQVTTTQKENEKGSYFQTVVASAMKVKRGKNDKCATNQVLTTIISPVEDYNSTKSMVQMVRKDGKSRTTVRANDQNKYDTPVYLIAIPFNGFIGKISDSKLYRIYRGLIIKSLKKDIEWRGNFYKKCAYMVVTPNSAVFAEDHKYHTDEIVFSVETYCLNTNKEDANDVTTVKTTVTLTIDQNGVKDISVLDETVDPVNPADFKGKEVFPLFQPDKKKPSDKRTRDRKPVRGKGSTFDNSATKTHSIKTEKNGYEGKSNKNLDQMIEKANKDFATRYKKKDKKKRR